MIDTIATYNKKSKEFANKFNTIGTNLRNGEIKKVFEMANIKNPLVVELGCANGRDSEEIMKYTNNFIGMDASEELLKIARQRNPQAKFVLSTFDDFVFPENIGIVFAFACLLHADKDSVKSVFKKVSDSMSKGGIFYISLKLGEYQKVIQEDEFGVRVFYLYTPDLIKELAETFEVVNTEFYEFPGTKWFMMIFRKV